MQKHWWLSLLLAVLVVVGAASHPAAARVLTSDNYTYMLKGRQLTVPVDILTIRNTQLVPEELLRALGVAAGLTGEAIGLERGPVQVELTLGSLTARVGGKQQVLPVAPMVVSGRLFVPAAILPSLGLDLAVDGRFVLLEDYLAAEPVPRQIPADAYAQLLAENSLHFFLPGVGDAFAWVSITRLTADLLAGEQLELDWGTRLRLLALLETQTLLLVSVENTSSRSITLDPRRWLITDESRHQHEYAGLEIEVAGRVTAPVAPGAIQVAVLGFDRAGGPLTIYDDASSILLGQVGGPR